MTLKTGLGYLTGAACLAMWVVGSAPQNSDDLLFAGETLAAEAEVVNESVVEGSRSRQNSVVDVAVNESVPTPAGESDLRAKRQELSALKGQIQKIALRYETGEATCTETLASLSQCSTQLTSDLSCCQSEPVWNDCQSHISTVQSTLPCYSEPIVTEQVISEEIIVAPAEEVAVEPVPEQAPLPFAPAPAPYIGGGGGSGGGGGGLVQFAGLGLGAAALFLALDDDDEGKKPRRKEATPYRK